MATAAEIQAEIAAGPQTQDALDAILVKYSPADLAAAYPQYSEDEYITAKAAAEQREFIAWQSSQPNPVGQGTIGDMYAAQGITDPKNDPRVLAIARQQVDRAQNREALFAEAGVQPGNLAPWTDPNWRETQAAARQAEAARQQRLAAQDARSGVTVGGGLVVNPGTRPTTPVRPSRGDGFGFETTPVTPATPATPVTPDYTGANLSVSNFGRSPFTDDLFSYFKNQSPFYYQDRPDSVERVAAIRDFYKANEGRTDPQAQSDLNRFLASGYTAKEFKTALPQYAQADFEKAIGAAYKEFPRLENSTNITSPTLGPSGNTFVAGPTVGPTQGLPNQANLDSSGLAALYANLNANLFDANSQTAQGSGNTGIAGLT